MVHVLQGMLRGKNKADSSVWGKLSHTKMPAEARHGGPAAGGMLVSAGADGTLAITDPRTWGLVKQIKLSNFPYSMMAAGGLAIVGLGDGSVWVVQCSSGEVRCCKGLGYRARAMEGKVLCSGSGI
eukprot:1155917-Pelagomonas_calceolata.AAC.4